MSDFRARAQVIERKAHDQLTQSPFLPRSIADLIRDMVGLIRDLAHQVDRLSGGDDGKR